MSNEKLTVQVTDISSSQEWTSDPDMIEVYIDREFLEKAEKCVAFMQEHYVDKTTIWWGFGYNMFEKVEAIDEDDLTDEEVVKDENDAEYVEFEPDYRLDGCHAEIYKDGEISAVFPFKHTSDTLWCTVGTLSDLKSKFTAAPVAA